MKFMNTTQIKKIHTNNQNVAWSKANNVAVMRFLDEGNDLSTATTLADELLFHMNWVLANPES